MTIGDEDVAWAYRLFLGREAAHDPAASVHIALGDRESLRRAFIGSAEFQAHLQQDAPSRVGAFQDVSQSPIETNCSPDDLSAMIKHIASEWRKYGAEAPHWSVLTNDQFKPDKIEENIENFYATGVGHAQTMLTPLSRSGISKTRFNRVLDFGCGVGRLTLALAPIADEIFGADISPEHLKFARERAGSDSNARFVALNGVDDIDTLGSFDLIVSFIVLQHNPPPVMAEILRKLLSRLSPGGCIIIQMPTFIDGYHFNSQAYLAAPNDGIAANVLPQHVIFDIFANAGCKLLEVRQDNFLGGASLSHTFAAQKA